MKWEYYLCVLCESLLPCWYQMRRFRVKSCLQLLRSDTVFYCLCFRKLDFQNNCKEKKFLSLLGLSKPMYASLYHDSTFHRLLYSCSVGVRV
jgi:hypothetical protein